jgi:hypothetical protein
MFGMMAYSEERWKSVRSVQSAPIYGTAEAVIPEPVPVNLETMIKRLHQGHKEWKSVWEQLLSPHNWQALAAILSREVSIFRFEAAHWADMVLDYAVAYHRGVLDRGQMMDSMVPLYYGRTASMVVESQAMDLATFEREVVQAQAEIFEQLKPQLIMRWETAVTSR